MRKIPFHLRFFVVSVTNYSKYKTIVNEKEWNDKVPLIGQYNCYHIVRNRKERDL